MSNLSNSTSQHATIDAAPNTAPRNRCLSRIVIAGAFGIALLSPLMAVPAFAQTETTTTVAASAAAGTEMTVVATATEDSTVSDEPVGGIDAGFGGTSDGSDQGMTGPALVVAAGLSGGAGVWMLRRRHMRRTAR